MQIIDFIEQCHQYIKIGKKLPKRKVSYKFLKQFGSHILNEYYSINIEYPIFVTKLNEIDQLAVTMVVNVYRKAPFYSIGYHYDITLKNRKKCNIFFEELDLINFSKEDIFNICKDDKEYIVNLLTKQGYSQLEKNFNHRVPLVDINTKMSSQYILGAQPYLTRLLDFGIEYKIRSKKRKRLSLDIDQSLVDIANQVIYLAKHSKYINDTCIVDGNIEKVICLDAEKILDSLCLKYGGKRLKDNSNAYVWHIGKESLDEGDVKLSSSVYIYISSYIKTFYAVVHRVIQVKNKELGDFEIKSITFGDATEIILGETTNMFYSAIESLESLGYRRQEELNYKLPVQVAGSSESKELEIGEILFGLKPDEYSRIDKVEKL